jgi:hypothetical protein
MAASVAAAALALAIAPADARYSRRYGVERKAAKKEPPANAIKGSLIIAVSLGSQRLTVYDDGVAIAHSPVSSGTAGHPTPTGVFSVIQKSRHHRSNIYSGAPMPFMQRITWSGVALHAGALPGYPASHGCIRLPNDFAARLWGMTKLGVRVIVTRNDVTPVSIAHARLAALHVPAVAAAPERRVDALRPGTGPDPAESATAAKGVRTAEATGVAVTSDVDPRPAEAADTAAVPPPVAVTPAPETTSAIDLALPSAATPAAVPASAPADVPTSSSVAEPASPVVEPATAAVQPASPATETAPPVPDPAMAALPPDEVFVPPDRPARPLRAGPVTVFVSRKDGRLYVRKRFDPLFSVPIAIKADQPIGTHVFTAAEGEAGALRWIAVSLPAELPKPYRASKPRRGDKGEGARGKPGDTTAMAPSTAAEALDRVEFSADVVERIAALVTPGASLIVSDQGLGHETGLETDFIVLSR